MDYDNGWGDFTDDLIDRVLHVLATSVTPNIVRPATVVVRKLILASPKPGSNAKGKQRAREGDAVNNYGFDRVFARIVAVGEKLLDEQHRSGPVERFFRAIVKRLEGTRDLELSAQRCVVDCGRLSDDPAWHLLTPPSAQHNKKAASAMAS